jgi:hypothetical protein
MLAMCAALVAAGVLVASPPVDGVWTDAGALIAQTSSSSRAASSPASRSAPPSWPRHRRSSRSSPSRSRGRRWRRCRCSPTSRPWLDTRLALAPLHEEVVSATQWAHAGTALAVWMLLPLLIGTWRITRREVSV